MIDEDSLLVDIYFLIIFLRWTSRDCKVMADYNDLEEFISVLVYQFIIGVSEAFSGGNGETWLGNVESSISTC